MTLDEAIFEFKERAEDSRKISELGIKSYIPKEKEEEQLAEWLEELKSYRASVFSGDMTQKMLKEEYCKAIDDFADKMNAKCDGMIKDKWNSNVAPVSWAEAYADFKDDIDEIAEQLKAGGKNEN